MTYLPEMRLLHIIILAPILQAKPSSLETADHSWPGIPWRRFPCVHTWPNVFRDALRPGHLAWARLPRCSPAPRSSRAAQATSRQPRPPRQRPSTTMTSASTSDVASNDHGARYDHRDHGRDYRGEARASPRPTPPPLVGAHGDYWDPEPDRRLLASRTQDFNPNGSRIVGDPYVYADPVSRRDYLFATGEDGRLLVVVSALRRCGLSRMAASTKVPAPTGRPLRELLGGRAFNSPLASPLAMTGTGADKTIHVFATDTADNLIHFWFKTHGGLMRWPRRQVREPHLRQRASRWRAWARRAWPKTGRRVEVCALDPDDELLYFRLAPGRPWSAENPEQAHGEGREEGGDVLHRSARRVRHDHRFLLSRWTTCCSTAGAADGTWTLEDITQETTTENARPRGKSGRLVVVVGLGRASDYWDPFAVPAPARDPHHRGPFPASRARVDGRRRGR